MQTCYKEPFFSKVHNKNTGWLKTYSKHFLKMDSPKNYYKIFTDLRKNVFEVAIFKATT